MPASQGDRTSALLIWAEALGGCGLSVLQDLLETIVNPEVSPSRSVVLRAAGKTALPNVDARIIHPILSARDWQDRPEFKKICEW